MADRHAETLSAFCGPDAQTPLIGFVSCVLCATEQFATSFHLLSFTSFCQHGIELNGAAGARVRFANREASRGELHDSWAVSIGSKYRMR